MVLNEWPPFDLAHVEIQVPSIFEFGCQQFMQFGGGSVIKNPLVVHEVVKLDANFFAFLHILPQLLHTLSCFFGAKYPRQVEQSVGGNLTLQFESEFVLPLIVVSH
jgi:hypothetical protein